MWRSREEKSQNEDDIDGGVCWFIPLLAPLQVENLEQSKIHCHSVARTIWACKEPQDEFKKKATQAKVQVSHFNFTIIKYNMVSFAKASQQKQSAR